MSFLYLFDMVDFDDKGEVCATKSCDLGSARANYLYLLSKYNQTLLQNEKLPIPAFFKEDLEGVLVSIRKGEDFEIAKSQILENCLNNVKILAKQSKSDKELISKLNDFVSENDKEFADKFSKAVNNLQLEYIITSISGNVFEELVKTLCKVDALQDKKIKSNTYKNIIKYNSLVATADKVKNTEKTTYYKQTLLKDKA